MIFRKNENLDVYRIIQFKINTKRFFSFDNMFNIYKVKVSKFIKLKYSEQKSFSLPNFIVYTRIYVLQYSRLVQFVP